MLVAIVKRCGTAENIRYGIAGIIDVVVHQGVLTHMHARAPVVLCSSRSVLGFP